MSTKPTIVADAESEFKKFRFRGLTFEEVSVLSLADFAKLITSRERRKIKHGFSHSEKKLLARIKRGTKGKFIRTKCRDMIILPEMVGVKLGIHNGKEFMTVEVKPDMLGHRIGEFAMTRKPVKHSGPGVGATRSSKFIPLK